MEEFLARACASSDVFKAAHDHVTKQRHRVVYRGVSSHDDDTDTFRVEKTDVPYANVKYGMNVKALTNGLRACLMGPDNRAAFQMHIRSFNWFVTTGLNATLAASPLCVVPLQDRTHNARVRLVVTVVNTRVVPMPRFVVGDGTTALPLHALRSGGSYTTPVEVDLRVDVTVGPLSGAGPSSTTSVPVNGLTLGNLAVLTRSAVCALRYANRRELMAAGHEPGFTGGTFVIGTHKVPQTFQVHAPNIVFVGRVRHADAHMSATIASAVPGTSRVSRLAITIVPFSANTLGTNNSSLEVIAPCLGADTPLPVTLLLRALGVSTTAGILRAVFGEEGVRCPLEAASLSTSLAVEAVFREGLSTTTVRDAEWKSRVAGVMAKELAVAPELLGVGAGAGTGAGTTMFQAPSISAIVALAKVCGTVKRVGRKHGAGDVSIVSTLTTAVGVLTSQLLPHIHSGWDAVGVQQEHCIPAATPLPPVNGVDLGGATYGDVGLTPEVQCLLVRKAGMLATMVSKLVRCTITGTELGNRDSMLYKRFVAIGEVLYRAMDVGVVWSLRAAMAEALAGGRGTEFTPFASRKPHVKEFLSAVCHGATVDVNRTAAAVRRALAGLDVFREVNAFLRNGQWPAALGGSPDARGLTVPVGTMNAWEVVSQLTMTGILDESAQHGDGSRRQIHATATTMCHTSTPDSKDGGLQVGIGASTVLTTGMQWATVPVAVARVVDLSNLVPVARAGLPPVLRGVGGDGGGGADYLLVVDGDVLGVIPGGRVAATRTYDALRAAKCDKVLPADTGVFMTRVADPLYGVSTLEDIAFVQPEVMVITDRGRLCRPLIRLDAPSVIAPGMTQAAMTTVRAAFIRYRHLVGFWGDWVEDMADAVTRECVTERPDIAARPHDHGHGHGHDTQTRLASAQSACIVAHHGTEMELRVATALVARIRDEMGSAGLGHLVAMVTVQAVPWLRLPCGKLLWRHTPRAAPALWEVLWDIPAFLETPGAGWAPVLELVDALSEEMAFVAEDLALDTKEGHTHSEVHVACRCGQLSENPLMMQSQYARTEYSRIHKMQKPSPPPVNACDLTRRTNKVSTRAFTPMVAARSGNHAGCSPVSELAAADAEARLLSALQFTGVPLEGVARRAVRCLVDELRDGVLPPTHVRDYVTEPGEPLLVIVSQRAFNGDDAISVNRHAVERGMGAILAYTTQSTSIPATRMDDGKFEWCGFTGTPRPATLAAAVRAAAEGCGTVEGGPGVGKINDDGYGDDDGDSDVEVGANVGTDGAYASARKRQREDVASGGASVVDVSAAVRARTKRHRTNADAYRGVRFDDVRPPAFWVMGYLSPEKHPFGVGVTVTLGVTDAEAEKVRKAVGALPADGVVEQGVVVLKDQALLVATCVTPCGAQTKLGATGPVCHISHVTLSYMVVYAEMGGVVERVRLRAELDTRSTRRVGSVGVEPVVVDTIVRSLISFEVGNKATTRYGQKGVVGSVLDPCDMPYDPATGLTAAVVLSPHGTLSRMFPGSLQDVTLSMHLAVVGIPWVDASDSLQVSGLAPLLDTAVDSGCSVVTLVNGATGEQMHGTTTMGILYLEVMKQVSGEAMHVHREGPVNETVRQPNRTDGKKGGIMEYNVGHRLGVAGYIRYFMVDTCDPHESLVCNACGSLWYTRQGTAYVCTTPKCSGLFVCVNIPFAPIAVADMISGMGVSVRVHTSVSDRWDREAAVPIVRRLQALLPSIQSGLPPEPSPVPSPA